MPRENQKRGRRAEEKAKKKETKRQRDEFAELPAPKRLKPAADNSRAGNEFDQNTDYVPLGGQDDEQEGRQLASADAPFYGLLDSDEQEYFSRANEVLELNQFQDDEERRLFVDSVYKEGNGKELKIACSQSCSRLMEKLIAMSDLGQVHRLFSKFIGHFLHLVQHRFASHCCETLFIQAVPGISQKAPKWKKGNRLQMSTREEEEQGEEDDGDELEQPELSLTEMFIKVVEELEGNWGYLLTERFASHTIRVLLLVLAGEPIDLSPSNSVVASRKKERLGVYDAEGHDDVLSQRREVPPIFENVLKRVINDIGSLMDDTYLRALATHPVGNPVLQVLLYLELHHFGKSSAKDSSSITRRLFPDESLEEGTSSATFTRGLFYDPVGARLLETIVRWAPAKLFKNLYKNIIHDNIGTFARNVTASYVVVRVLERLGKDDLQNAMELILPMIPSLVERSRLIIPKALIDRSVVRSVDSKPLARALESSYDFDPARRLFQILNIKNDSPATMATDDEQQQKEKPAAATKQSLSTSNSEKLHGSLLAQTMLKVAGPISELVFDSLLAQSTDSLVSISKDPTTSHVIQQALTATTATLQFRKQFTNRFQGRLKDLALDTSGSHVVDALWPATKDIFFVKERMAQELAQNERILRDSFVGRAVWRNWSMDLYNRRRSEWVSKAKGQHHDDRNNGEDGNASGQPKSKIDLARARFAAKAAGEETSKEKTKQSSKAKAIGARNSQTALTAG